MVELIFLAACSRLNGMAAVATVAASFPNSRLEYIGPLFALGLPDAEPVNQRAGPHGRQRGQRCPRLPNDAVDHHTSAYQDIRDGNQRIGETHRAQLLPA